MSVPLPRVMRPGALHSLMAQAAARAAWRRTPVLVSYVEPVDPVDPLALLSRTWDDFDARLLWRVPGGAFSFAGLGTAAALTAAGPGRVGRIREAWRELAATALVDGAAAPPNGTGLGLILAGGFAFDPWHVPAGSWAAFPSARFTVPRWVIGCSGGVGWMACNVLVDATCPVADTADVLEQERAGLFQALREAGEATGRPIGETELGEAGGTGGRATGETTRSDRAADPVVAHPPAEAWMDAVARAAQAIRAGHLEKVVLARQVEVAHPRAVPAPRLLQALAGRYAEAYTFAFGHGDACFLGATPEQLARVEADALWSMCLAGSAGRGASPEEDEALAQALLHSAKERHEHAVVARMLREALEGLCAELDVPAAPGLLRLRNVQHLYTPVRGRLRPPYALFDVVERLHPTPAVAGFPREEALRWIRQLEGFDRGWYAGAVGWCDADGQGEFAVAIRSALVCGRQVQLFAGCGVMGDSDPAAEYRESCLKARAMLSALEEARA